MRSFPSIDGQSRIRSVSLCSFALDDFLAVGAVPGAWADLLRVIAAGVRTVFIDRALPCLGVQKAAVAIGPTCQREKTVAEIEVLDHAHFLQALGQLFRVGFQVELVNHVHAHQITRADFCRHGAANGLAGVAQAVAVFDPGIQVVTVCTVDDAMFLHAGSNQGWALDDRLGFVGRESD